MPFITDIDKQISDAISFVKFGQPIEVAFRRLKKNGFTGPQLALKQSVNLAWLLSQKETSADEIRNLFRPVVCRGMEVYAAVNSSAMRDSCDLLFLALSVFVQDPVLLEEVARIVLEADEQDPKYYAAFAGIMKFHILREPLRMQNQLRLFLSFRGKASMLRVASKMFTEAFVQRDIKKIHRERRKTEREFWTSLGFSEGAAPQSLTLDLRDDNRFWPWPEAVLLRLLEVEMPSDIDRFWFPTPLCK